MVLIILDVLYPYVPMYVVCCAPSESQTSLKFTSQLMPSDSSSL